MKQTMLMLTLLLGYHGCSEAESAARHATGINPQQKPADFYPNLGKDEWVDDYIAAQSGHSRGSTVGLTLVQRVAYGNSVLTEAIALPLR